ncbi:acyltransferase family protein [Actinopolymorpha sp. B17G11]|uniref:acyltransferase family protein n=1 Tax=Actinopolymorpha sp. B17G11 TaxID=3160861 RepID=UPI0032E36CEF
MNDAHHRDADAPLRMRDARHREMRNAQHRETQRATSGFRGDIEGLRGLAVLLVLVFHAGVPAVPGGFVGVDVFFVISGFLITGLIVREVRTTGRLSLARFYARRARRLLPAAAVVLAAVAGLTVAVLPPIRWSGVGGDLAASALYAVNWRLADQAVDYMASEQASSPVQHFWSLAVEEQFYLVWPLVLLALVWWHRRTGWSLDRTLLAGLAIVALPSLVWSVSLTQVEPGRAYFVSTTRAWELAIGAALAIGAVRLSRLPRAAMVWAGWLGVSAIVVAALAYGSSTLFPGYAALLPTVGAALVVMAGLAGRGGDAAGTGGVEGYGRGVGRFLSVAPMRAVGALSYSLYLWHWPLLVAAEAAWGALSVVEGILVASFSFAPAWLTNRLVEAPVRRSGRLVAVPRRALLMGAACTAAGVAGAVIVHAAVPPPPQVTASAGSRPATQALAESSKRPTAKHPPQDEPTSITLDPLKAREDKGPIYRPQCHQDQPSAELQFCAYGDLGSDKVMVLAGDSHAAQWQPALAAVATRHGWRLETYTKSACGFFDVEVGVGEPAVPYRACTAWNAKLRHRLTGPDRPDLVVTSSDTNYQVVRGGSILDPRASRPAYVSGLRRSWQAVRAAGVPLVVIRNTPRVNIDVPDCLSAHPRDLAACAVPREHAMAMSTDDQIRAAEGLAGVDLVDLTDDVCPAPRCAPVIGTMIVWRDAHHITATYARSLAPRLDRAMAQAIGGRTSSTAE